MRREEEEGLGNLFIFFSFKQNLSPSHNKARREHHLANIYFWKHYTLVPEKWTEYIDSIAQCWTCVFWNGGGSQPRILSHYMFWYLVQSGTFKWQNVCSSEICLSYMSTRDNSHCRTVHYFTLTNALSRLIERSPKQRDSTTFLGSLFHNLIAVNQDVFFLMFNDNCIIAYFPSQKGSNLKSRMDSDRLWSIFRWHIRLQWLVNNMHNWPLALR